MWQGNGHGDGTTNAEKPCCDLQYKAGGPDFKILPGPLVCSVNGSNYCVHLGLVKNVVIHLFAGNVLAFGLTLNVPFWTELSNPVIAGCVPHQI